MLVQCALLYLLHSGCGRVPDTARGEAKCCIRQLDHTPSAINNVRCFVPTLSNTYRKDVNKVRMVINNNLTNGHGT